MSNVRRLLILGIAAGLAFSVVGNTAEQHRRTFLCKKYLTLFSSRKRAFSLPKGLLKQKQ